MLNFKVKYYLKKIEILHFVYYFYKNKTYNKFKNLDCSIIESYKWFNLMDENYAFLPTFPSSGMNYLINIINYYLNKKIYKKKFFFFNENEYYKNREFKYNFTSIADLRGTSNIKKRHKLDFKLILTHSLVDEIPYLRKKLFFNNKILFSYSKKENLKLNYNLDHLKRFVNFYNSYAEFILKKETCLIFSEDLINNRFLTFKKILSYLNNGKKFGKIDDNILKESIEFFNFSNELKRADKHSKTNYFKGLGNYHNMFTLNEKKKIWGYLEKNLNTNIFFLFKKYKNI